MSSDLCQGHFQVMLLQLWATEANTQRMLSWLVCKAVKAEFPFCFALYNIRFGIFMKLSFLPKTFTYELPNGSVNLIY